MLTTTIDGLWVLQVLSGIEALAPELGLRPHLPSIESDEIALAHPIAGELRTAGVIDGNGAIDTAVLEWLTVLSRRDISLLLYAQTSTAGGDRGVVLLARFAHWWVTLGRRGDIVYLGAAGTAVDEESAVSLISSQVERFCGELKPAPLQPVTLDVSQMTSAVRDRRSLAGFLGTQKLDTDQLALLMIAADSERSAQASFVAIQSGTPTAAQPYIDTGAVTVIDTPRGRLLAENIVRESKPWLIISPASTSQIASAVRSMMRRLPARPDWHSYRRVS